MTILGCIVLKATPVTAFAMRQAKILFRFPKLVLNVPAHLGNEDRMFHYGIAVCRSQPIFDWLHVVLWRFDQQPFSLLKSAIMRHSMDTIPILDLYDLSSVRANSWLFAKG